MAKKLMAWKTKGMNRDLSVSAFNPEFSFENINLRLSTNEGNTMMSWVNERSTGEITLHSETSNGESEGTMSIEGTVIGTAVLNHQLVLFTTDITADYIYRFKYINDEKTQMSGKRLYSGKLGFDAKHPLQTLVSYESENVQKVYWTDGINQPRVINIAKESYTADTTQFDFVPTLSLNEKITVEKQLGGNGLFAPGVIQYAFTYYRKYGQESCIFYTSPLLYISHKDRGASPEDKVENAFKITVESPDYASFDFLRIYSIHRTSINATPVVKRIQDLSLKDKPSKVSYIDTGTSGNTVDPTELLYKGGESITAETLEQKDGTLFLSNLSISRAMIESTLRDEIKSCISLPDQANTTRTIKPMLVSSGTYVYHNQLTSLGTNRHTNAEMTLPCGGFKTGDYYRCGVQFQHKTGRWSDPIWIKDVQISGRFNITGSSVQLPTIEGTLENRTLSDGTTLISALMSAGYRRIRPVVVFPNPLDRETICQGVVSPTVYTENHRNTSKDGDTYAQSSWFFRPYCGNDDTEGTGTTTISPLSKNTLRYTNKQMENTGLFNPQYIRQVEIEGQFDADNQFKVDREMRTLHSPDVEFDIQLAHTSFQGVSYRQVGSVKFTNTLSDIDIQTESPTVSSIGSGFIHKAFSSSGPKGIVSGLFYDDCLVDDNVNDTGEVRAWPKQRASVKFLIYPWQGNGSLNNDFLRPADKGTATSVLKKKIISNLRYTTTSYANSVGSSYSIDLQMFSSDEPAILKFSDNNIYKGNIDTMVVPDDMDGVYFAFEAWDNGMLQGETPTAFDSKAWCKTCNNNNVGKAAWRGIRRWYGGRWEFWNHGDDEIGDTYIDLLLKKLPVRIKYKSTPHLVGKFSSLSESADYTLPVVEIVRTTDSSTRYGGTSMDALKENVWIPCGEPIKLTSGSTKFYYDYGDTYFQRYDCLKTYPFTRDDPNQVVEIGSFMLETRTNIDGRYDRNRGQSNNLNMSPVNFNLLNLVYSQTDNFFSYRIQDDSFYENNTYPNQVTWSKTKDSDADIDLWTNMTMASVLELDGDKGSINKLVRFNDQLICFQDSGISQILYNENTQISTTEGVPIEISNSGKVQGKRYLSNTIGCSNKWSVVQTPSGIYFMDSNDKSIYLFSGQLVNLSQQGMNAWSKANIPSQEKKWNPVDFENFVGYYDKMNQDILFIDSETALAWSERFSTFPSFYSYGNTPFFCNLDDTGIWVRGKNLWKHHGGTDYCRFFGAETTQPYSITLIGNPEPQTDKTFTNIEFRANTDGEGMVVNRSLTDTFDETFDYTFHPDPNAIAGFEFYLPFDSLEVWNEYQHGITTLSQKNGRGPMQHYLSDATSHLARKYRIWRCDIPRNNYPLPTTDEETLLEKQKGIYRKIRTPNDRMRNPWLYLKLQKVSGTDKRTEIHDLVMTYFN